MMSPSNPATSSPSSRAVARIKEEHRALARVIAAMRILVSQFRDRGAGGDLPLFDAMLRYVENVPDRLHHPREDQTLFAALIAADPGSAVLVGILEGEHGRCSRMLADLRSALSAFRAGEANAINRLSDAVEDFADFYWAHMRAEEEKLIPRALERVDADAWERIDRAFSDHQDPLFGAPLADEYAALYRFIAAHASAPAASVFGRQAARTQADTRASRA